MMNELPFTPSVNKPRRGPAIAPAWVRYNNTLQNKTIRDGRWYDLDLTGLSFHYARKLAIQAGFKTSKAGDVLKVMFPQP